MKSSIFFSEQIGDYVVDELCKCGHLKSEHGSKTINMKGYMFRESGKGNCCGGGCVCKKFIFARFVAINEAAEIIASKRLITA